MNAGCAIYVAGLPAKGVAACVTCHGQHGEGTEQFPRIGGQHADYVMKQLDVFRSTTTPPTRSIRHMNARGGCIGRRLPCSVLTSHRAQAGGIP